MLEFIIGEASRGWYVCSSSEPTRYLNKDGKLYSGTRSGSIARKKDGYWASETAARKFLHDWESDFNLDKPQDCDTMLTVTETIRELTLVCDKTDPRIHGAIAEIIHTLADLLIPLSEEDEQAEGRIT